MTQTKAKEIKAKKKGGQTDADFLFMDRRVSTQENRDPTYMEVGIIHYSKPFAISLLRDFIGDIANMFGNAGIDNSVIDKARNEGLQEVLSKLKPNQKISNLKMEMERIDESLILINIYGTVMHKIAKKSKVNNL